MYRKYSKPVIDFCVSFILVICLSPVLVTMIILLHFSNQGEGVFFTQTRTGKNAKLFKIKKFRTMTNKRDFQGRLLPDDARVTPVGKFVRNSSLDEIPQLFNVLNGDMSLIGPRPLLEKYIPLYSKTQFRRHEIKPGITGWAQVNGRNNISWKKKFELDVWYVDNQSFLLDLKILGMTVIKVLKRKDITTEDPKQFQPFNGKN